MVGLVADSRLVTTIFPGLAPVGTAAVARVSEFTVKACRRDAPNCHLRRLRETHSGDLNQRLHRTARRHETRELGRDPEYLIAGQRSARSRHSHRPGLGSSWHNSHEISVGLYLEVGRDSVE